MHLVWRIGLGIACVGLAIGLFAVYGPDGGDTQAANPVPTTTQVATTTAPTNDGPLEAALVITKKGIAEPVSLSVGAGQPIKLTVTVSTFGHLALVGDDEAGGFLEPGTSLLEFTVKKPGTYQMQLHTDAPDAIELGELVVVP